MPRIRKTQKERVDDYMKAETYLPKWMRGRENQSKVFRAFEAERKLTAGPHRNSIMTYLKWTGTHGYKQKKVTGDLGFKSMDETLKPKYVSVSDMLEAKEEGGRRDLRKRRKTD